MVVGHLERPEAGLADVARLKWVGGSALLAFQSLEWHPIAFFSFQQKNLYLVRGVEVRSDFHISQALPYGLAGVGTFLEANFEGVAGVSSGQSLHPS
jgi:hypothetical protein